MQLQLTDGTTTVTLSGTSPVTGCTYFPNTPERKGGMYSDVTETAQVVLAGTAANIRTTVNSIERLLEQAALRQAGGTNPKVYVNYAPVSETAHRSEVLEGRVIWDTNPGLRRLGDTNPTVRIAVIWRRRFYWEGAETSLGTATVNNGPTGNTLTYNSITGSLPAPVRLTMTNPGASIATRRFYVANDVTNLFATTDQFLYVAGGSESVTWSGSANHSNNLWTINVPTALAATLRGERYRVWAAFSSIPDNVYVRASVQTVISGVPNLGQAGGELLASGNNGKQLMDLGALNMPPSGYIGTSAVFSIVLSFYANFGGSATLLWVMIAPAHTTLDLRQAGYNIATNQAVVHDGIEGVDYLSLASKYPGIERTGELLLYPGQQNKLRFLWDEGNTFNAARQLSVAGVYRPRRLLV